MLTEGVHEITEDVYHGDPCPEPSLSSSIAKLLVGRSPRHAWAAHPKLNPEHKPKASGNFDLGTAFHALFLGKGAGIEIVHADDWRTKAAQEARAAARAAGRTPMLSEQHDRAQEMVRVVREQIDADHPELARAFAAGVPERALVWREDNGVWCRALLDWMPESGPLYPDLKTTESAAHPDAWSRILFDMGYDVSDAFYRRGLRKLGLASEDAFLEFVAVEVEAPLHLIATHRMHPMGAALADRKVERAIALWGACLKANRWPGYRRETAWHQPKPWAEEQWMEREGALDQLIDELEAAA